MQPCLCTTACTSPDSTELIVKDARGGERRLRGTRQDVLLVGLRRCFWRQMLKQLCQHAGRCRPRHLHRQRSLSDAVRYEHVRQLQCRLCDSASRLLHLPELLSG